MNPARTKLVGIISCVSLPPRVRLPSSQPAMPYSRNSSFGESFGWLSEAPFICTISCTGSKRCRRSAYSLVKGEPSKACAANMRPFDRLPLCGIASARPPVRCS